MNGKPGAGLFEIHAYSPIELRLAVLGLGYEKMICTLLKCYVQEIMYIACILTIGNT